MDVRPSTSSEKRARPVPAFALTFDQFATAFSPSGQKLVDNCLSVHHLVSWRWHLSTTIHSALQSSHKMTDGVEKPRPEGVIGMSEEDEGTYDVYVDSEFAALQQMISQKKRAARDDRRPKIQQRTRLSRIPSSGQHQKSQLIHRAVPVPLDSVSGDGAVSVLLAHVVSTICKGDMITDADMACPKDWRELGGRPMGSGHQRDGRTVAVHSLVVAPKLHGCGLGKMIVKAFLQQVNNAGIADRVALVCQDYLVRYFERFGFKRLGPSEAKFGGGAWNDMAFDFARPPKSR
ncbi:hypothetical protein P8C59_001305 [Phyllachora maydis]|uniref:N-acetyltransferase domain-containing protein n=1 Tax=Phyllachora maydis TaxID=1825666 RepID=A0AAD9MB84_9PEZI|nr:hypothetical protein P8C59_001305 [Phyllachora maydis]